MSSERTSPHRYALTNRELAELDRRVAEPEPSFADPEEIAASFGKPFTSLPGER